MPISLLARKVMNPYQSKTPAGFYDKVKGHGGEDYQFKVGETLAAPISGTITHQQMQPEMGLTVYLKHSTTGDVWVFCHAKSFLCKVGQLVGRGEPLMLTGATGSKCTAPHVHVEVITQKPLNPEDKIMTRSLMGYTGYNTCPSKRLQGLYKQFNIDPVTLKVI
jgi:murein DD-endopeptidase MepM/ murein hydrolase activator NlpD